MTTVPASPGAASKTQPASVRAGSPPDGYRAWVAQAPQQPLVLERLEPGPLGPEEVEVAVEHCGLCHSELSVLNNEWGLSQYPAVLGHEVVGIAEPDPELHVNEGPEPEPKPVKDKPVKDKPVEDKHVNTRPDPIK